MPSSDHDTLTLEFSILGAEIFVDDGELWITKGRPHCDIRMSWWELTSGLSSLQMIAASSSGNMVVREKRSLSR